MKTFKAYMSPEPSLGGTYSISSGTVGERLKDFSLQEERSIFSEKCFLNAAKTVIEKKMGLKIDHGKNRTLNTLEMYIQDDGTLVEIANDEFFGIMVESKDPEIIKKIFAELNKEET